MTTAPATIDFEALALANVGAAPRGSEITSYEVKTDATAADFQVGQVVAIYSRGNDRLAVVEKVGRTNVTVVYATPGGVRESERIYENYVHSNPESYRAGTERQARKNYRFYVSQADGTCDLFTTFASQYPPERIAKEKAHAETWLAEVGTEDEHAAASGQAAVDSAKARKADALKAGPHGFVTFTHKSVKFDKVGIKVGA